MIGIAFNHHFPRSLPDTLLTVPLIIQPLLEPVLHIVAVASADIGMLTLWPIEQVEPVQFVEIVDGEHVEPVVLRDGIHTGVVAVNRVG
ncbi:hypothetical protein FQZ97_869710 [compost metagenome]